MKAKINPSFTYKTRSGRKVTNINQREDDYKDNPYTFTADVEGYGVLMYTNRGYYNSDAIHNLDLIKQPVRKPKVTKEIKALKGYTNLVKTSSFVADVVHNKPPIKSIEDTCHIHHNLIIVWVKNPSIKIQFKSKYEPYEWSDIAQPSWEVEYEYRFKPEEPKLLTIIGHDGKARSYPEPCKVGLTRRRDYYIPWWTGSDRFFSEDYWTGTEADYTFLDRGLVHLTKEAAELHAKAMLGVD